MPFNRRVAVTVIGIGFGAFALLLAAQSNETFKARLSALPADAKTRADLAGSGSASAVLTGTKLAISGSFSRVALGGDDRQPARRCSGRGARTCHRRPHHFQSHQRNHHRIDSS